MRYLQLFLVVGLAIALVATSYFGAYFLVADYVDVGDNVPLYLLRYRIGTISLPGFDSFLEPARQVDDSILRGRNATVIEWRDR